MLGSYRYSLTGRWLRLSVHPHRPFPGRRRDFWRSCSGWIVDCGLIWTPFSPIAKRIVEIDDDMHNTTENIRLSKVKIYAGVVVL